MLVMSHMADKDSEPKVFKLGKKNNNEHFISFVDLEQGEHDASIGVLIYCPKEKE